MTIQDIGTMGTGQNYILVGTGVLDGPFPRNVTFAPCGRSKPLPYRMTMYYIVGTGVFDCPFLFKIYL